MLKVWLPLNGDLHNQGLADVTVTNNGATINNSGKIGKCYEFGSSKYLSINNKIIDSDTFTVSFWIYANNITGNKCLLCCRNAINKAFAIYLIGAQIRVDTGTNWSTSYSIAATTWTHITFVNNGSKQELYINGSLEKTRSATIDTSSITQLITIGCEHINGGSIGTYFGGRINDLRIYDHVLSAKEIKELSKGLVLHYPLNRGGFGGDNLLKDSINFGASWTSAISKSETINTENEITYMKLWHNTTSSWTQYATYNYIFKLNQPYTISLLARKTNTDGVNPRLGIRNDRNAAITFFTPSTGYPIDSTEWKYYSFSINNVSSTTYTDKTEPLRFYAIMTSEGDNRDKGALNANSAIQIAMVKLEEGSTPTPWIPNSADALYSSMGLNSNIEYDVSGYQNNGTITGTLNYSSDTPKYSVSTAFDGTQKILTPSFTSEIKTMSAWVKTTKNKSTSQLVCADSASKLCISFYSGCIISYFASSGHSTGSRCTLGSSYIENGWNHIVVISTGSGTRDVYCNGVKLTPTSNDYWSPAAGFLIGSRNTSSAPIPFYGYISDVRAYATALSADDVLELYHTPASITNNGTLMTQGELSEV